MDALLSAFIAWPGLMIQRLLRLSFFHEVSFINLQRAALAEKDGITLLLSSDLDFSNFIVHAPNELLDSQSALGTLTLLLLDPLVDALEAVGMFAAVQGCLLPIR